MKKYSILIAIVCLLLVALSGCDFGKDNSTKENGSSTEFSENTGVTIEAEISDTEINIIHGEIVTNSEKLKVTNLTSGRTITVYLFQDDNQTEPIMTFLLESSKTKTFTNLSSIHAYSIGVSIDNLDEAITVSCKIND